MVSTGEGAGAAEIGFVEALASSPVHLRELALYLR